MIANWKFYFLPTCCLLMLLGCADTSTETATNVDAEDNSPTEKTTDQFEPIQLIAEFKATQNPSLGKFADLDPAESGIDYMHVWNPPPIHRSIIVGTFGNGVAVGDFDNDGWQDVFIGRQHEAGKLYRNLSGMKFEDVTASVGIDPAGMWTVGTTFVDINNDGRLDLYLCGFECPNRLYINEGDTFRECAAEYGLDFNGSSLIMNFADYDRDGDLDGYLVTNFKKPRSRINKPQLIRKPGQPPEVAPEFLERMFLVKHPDGTYRKSKAGQFDYLFRNDGGKFTNVTESAGIGLNPYIGLSSSWWDYNNDGWPDLYVANDFKGPDFLYRNNGPGSDGNVTFTDVSRQSLPHTPWYSMGSDFADINNDGKLDYLASDMAGTNHYRDKLSMGSMSGPDSNAWFLNAVEPPQYMRNALYVNTGTEKFGEAAFLSGLAKTDWTWTVKFADFDNDGWQDVFFTNGMTRDLFNSDLKNELEDKIKLAKQGNPNFRPGPMAMEFWENQEPFRTENMAFQNVGDFKFKDVGADWGLNHLGVSMGAAVGDLDNDGDLDLVVNGFEEQVKVYRNDLPSEKSIRFKLAGKESNRFGLGTRVDLFYGDGQTQTRYSSPTRGFMSTSENALHFGVGNHNTVNEVVVHWPSGSMQRFENLKTNSLYKINEPDASESQKANTDESDSMFADDSSKFALIQHQEIEFNDFQRQPLLPNKHSQLGPGLAWADIDGDGDHDCFMGGARIHAGVILKNSGKGNFEKTEQADLESDKLCEDLGALFFDADGDDDQDLYVVSGGVECEPGSSILKDRLYLNDGSGNFSRAVNWLPEIRESGCGIACCDFDRDGDLDLFIGGRIIPGSYPESPKSYLLKNEGDKFIDATDELAAGLSNTGMINAAVWSDVDGDDWSDLLLATEWGPVRFFKNDAGKLTEQTASVGLGKRLGWYNSICGGDIDNDGDIDFVVGNTGLNTKYKATFEKPELLYYGDFEGTGRKRIVEAKYENGVCLPRRGLSCSSHAMPMIKDKTPTYHEFAISSLDDLYTDSKLDEATKFEANSLESCVLINETENGAVKFSFRPLPRLAQASPIFGCQMCDVDGDGNLDVYAVQNFYGPQRETGYFDGGVSLLMMGDGSGDLKPIDAKASGLLISGDATSLTVADLNQDSKPDFVVGKNNASPMLFVSNQTTSKSTHFAVDLTKMTKAKNLFGTKIVAEYSDGSHQLMEYRSNNGYLSQSAPVVFVGKGIARKLAGIKLQFPDGTTDEVSVAAPETQVSSK